MSAPLPRSSPQAQGIAPGAIIRTVEALQKQEIHSLMIVRRGHVVTEGWWKPFSKGRVHELFSLSKSFCSTAVGLAVSDHKLTLEDRVLSFFPDLAPANPSENLRQMRVRDLLTMSTGHHEAPWMLEAEGDLRQAFLAHPVEHEPGKHFVYNSMATYMCSAIVRKVTGQTLTEYLKPRLYEPLGIEHTPWDTDAQGTEMGGWGLSVATEDIAKFGLLYLQDGEWQGKRLLPRTWVGQATAKQVRNGDEGPSDWAQGYGFQFWRCQPGCYRGDGAFGQLCVVVPWLDLVVAVQASVDDIQSELNALWENLLPAVQDGPIEGSSDELEEMLESLALPTIAGSGRAVEDLGGRYTLSGEPSRLAIEVAPGNVHLDFGDGGSVLAGFGRWMESQFSGHPVAACAAWEGEALRVRVRFLERTRGEDWTVTRAGTALTITREGRGILGGAPTEPLTGQRV